MEQDDLRAICQYLYSVPELAAAQRNLDIYADCLYRILMHNTSLKSTDPATIDAWILARMMWNKALNLRVALSGINYAGFDGGKASSLIDPTIVGGLTRNIFETAALFNIIYRSAITNDQTFIAYSLWVHSALKYRQKFKHDGTTPENLNKAAQEEREMELIRERVKSTDLYKSLSEDGKQKIETRFKQKAYLIKFKGNEVQCLEWDELPAVMGIKPELVRGQYNYFSQFAHPTNTSVFQYAGMLRENSTHGGAKFLSEFAFIYFSCFIADYIVAFPDTLAIYNEMPLVNQIVINFFNIFPRGENFSINDSGKALG